MPYKMRPRPRRAPAVREEIAMNSDNAIANCNGFSDHDDSAFDDVAQRGICKNEHVACDEYVEQRTFLCEVLPLRRANSVVQSTTEAHSRHGINPRRVSV